MSRNSFSIGDAVGAGFKVIGRYPVAVLMWGVAYFVLTQLAGVVIWLTVGQGVMQSMQGAMTGGATPDAAAMLRAEQPFLLLAPFQLILFLVYYAVVNAAVFRAVLEPSDKGFFFMRLGSRELTQALVIICQFICAVLLGGGLALLVGVGVATLAGREDVGLRFLIGFVAVIAAFAIYIWLWLRFSMAGPMSFAQRNFRLFESWSVTAGNAWKLFGLGFLLWAMLFIVLIAVEMVLGGVIMASMGMSGGFTPTSMANGGPFANMTKMMPIWMGVGAVFSLLAGGFHAILLAPWAEAYRQMTGHNDLATTVSAFE